MLVATSMIFAFCDRRAVDLAGDVRGDEPPDLGVDAADDPHHLGRAATWT